MDSLTSHGTPSAANTSSDTATSCYCCRSSFRPLPPLLLTGEQTHYDYLQPSILTTQGKSFKDYKVYSESVLQYMYSSIRTQTHPHPSFSLGFSLYKVGPPSTRHKGDFLLVNTNHTMSMTWDASTSVHACGGSDYSNYSCRCALRPSLQIQSNFNWQMK